ncbi:unnamed protein product [Paramecium pentaurelia]|uniref:Uncharacterized protein n=1 Tax=Paramecium pentaurelia TaxID=43138 RepID=A0A8S1WI29_9CILI|nr:unnamed protein product [Paramecium pentaurelia]
MIFNQHKNLATYTVKSFQYGLMLEGYDLRCRQLIFALICYLIIFQLGIRKKNQIRQLLRSATKMEILHEIKTNLSYLKLGFADGNYTDKTLAVNILKAIDPNHYLVKSPKCRINQILHDDIMLIRLLIKLVERKKEIEIFSKNEGTS